MLELAQEQVLHLTGVEREVREQRRRVGVREVERDPVVRPDRLYVHAQGLAEPGAQRHGPGGVHAAAEG